MSAKDIYIFVLVFILDTLQQEIRALQNNFTLLPGVSLNFSNTTVAGSAIICCNMCLQDGPDCAFASYSETDGICKLGAVQVPTFSSEVVIDSNIYSRGLTYAWVALGLTWDDARAHCAAKGWHLADIQTVEEKDRFTHALSVRFGVPTNPGLSFWVGASRQSQIQFVWTDDTPVDFGWVTGHPTNNGECAYVTSASAYSWEASDCSLKPFFICEYQ